MQSLPLPKTLKQIDIGCLSQMFQLPLGALSHFDWLHLRGRHGPAIYPLEIVSAATRARAAIRTRPGHAR
eukprot:9462008-Pyramimonas_sp.AAC.1